MTFLFCFFLIFFFSFSITLYMNFYFSKEFVIFILEAMNSKIDKTQIFSFEILKCILIIRYCVK